MRVRNFGSRTPELPQRLYTSVTNCELTARATKRRACVEPVATRGCTVAPPSYRGFGRGCLQERPSPYERSLFGDSARSRPSEQIDHVPARPREASHSCHNRSTPAVTCMAILLRRPRQLRAERVRTLGIAAATRLARQDMAEAQDQSEARSPSMGKCSHGTFSTRPRVVPGGGACSPSGVCNAGNVIVPVGGLHECHIDSAA